MPENPPPPPSNLNDIESWPHGDVWMFLDQRSSFEIFLDGIRQRCNRLLTFLPSFAGRCSSQFIDYFDVRRSRFLSTFNCVTCQLFILKMSAVCVLLGETVKGTLQFTQEVNKYCLCNMAHWYRPILLYIKL